MGETQKTNPLKIAQVTTLIASPAKIQDVRGGGTSYVRGQGKYDEKGQGCSADLNPCLFH